MSAGTAETKTYYDHEGWKQLPDGRSQDIARWGAREVGPLRVAAHEIRMRRVRQALAEAGQALNLLECGCGGEPEQSILDVCARYTGVDFSLAGLQLARERLKDVSTPLSFVQADICSMPFEKGEFDAIYSSHAIYHIRDTQAQAAAFREVMRVTRGGGVAVFILHNPRPLMFPGRLIRRLVADTPGLRSIANKLRRAAPIPYNPRPLGWMRRQLAPFGRIEIIEHSIASVWFDHHVTEKEGLGRYAWEAMLWLHRYHPKLAARLGNYVQITVRKR